LKIAYLINQYPKVSHSFIRREILALERQGVEVLRLSVRGWDAELVDAGDIAERDRTQYLLRQGVLPLFVAALQAALRTPRRFLHALRLALRMGRKADRPWPYHLIYLAEACKAVHLLRSSEAEHIHAHFGTNSAEVALLAGVLCDIPFSFTVHGPDEFDRPEFIALAEKVCHAKFVVAISSYGRSQLVRWAGHQHWDKVKVVHCGLERDFHEVAEVPASARHLRRFVCVGRLSSQKGQLLLVAAAAELASQGIDFELVLAGDGEMRADVEAEISRLGLTRQVRVTGWISSAQVRDEIQSARALVLPSFAEGLPVVIMEAMALRRPVLTTYVAGIPELVIAGEAGWLFPAGSVRELVEAMKDCLALSIEGLDAMGARARERALERHDVDREVSRLAGHFREATTMWAKASV